MTKEERAQAVEWFGARGTRLWTSHQSIKDLVKDLIQAEVANEIPESTVSAIREVFELMLGWADRMVHTTGISTVSNLQDSVDDPDTGFASSGPTLDQTKQAVMLTQTAFSLILDAVLPRFAGEADEQLTAATSRAWRSHPDIERLTAMQPTDRCICDRPNGTWAECHMRTDKYADHDVEARLLKAVRLSRKH